MISSFIKTFASLTLTVNSYAQSEPVPAFCRAEPVKSTFVKGRAFKVNRADGNSITIVGHFHGDREADQIAVAIADGSFDKLSNADFEKTFRDLYATNALDFSTLNTRARRYAAAKAIYEAFRVDVRPFAELDSSNGLEMDSENVIDHARGDYNFLKNLINAQSNNGTKLVSYVASEALIDDEDVIVKGSKYVHDYVLNAAGQRKIRDVSKSSEWFMDSLMASIGGFRFLKIRSPELFQGIASKGTEETEAAKALVAAGDIWGEMELRANDIIKRSIALIKAIPSANGKMGEIEKQKYYELIARIYFLNANVLLGTLPVKDRLEFHIAEIEKLAPPAMKESVRLFGILAMKKHKITRNRDQKVVDYLSGADFSAGNTVHFVGLAHLSERVRMLEKACASKLNGTR